MGGGLGTISGRWPRFGGECTMALIGPLVQAAKALATAPFVSASQGPPRPGSSGPLNKSALSRSRRALGSHGSSSFPFMWLAAPASLACLHQRDCTLLASSKRYFMLKFNGEMLTSSQNKARRNTSCSNRLNFAPLCGGSCPQLAATTWHILIRLDANAAPPPASAPFPWNPCHGAPVLGVQTLWLAPLILGL